jgi:hypothetical protein
VSLALFPVPEKALTDGIIDWLNSTLSDGTAGATAIDSSDATDTLIDDSTSDNATEADDTAGDAPSKRNYSDAPQPSGKASGSKDTSDDVDDDSGAYVTSGGTGDDSGDASDDSTLVAPLATFLNSTATILEAVRGASVGGPIIFTRLQFDEHYSTLPKSNVPLAFLRKEDVGTPPAPSYWAPLTCRQPSRTRPGRSSPRTSSRKMRRSPSIPSAKTLRLAPSCCHFCRRSR